MKPMEEGLLQNAAKQAVEVEPGQTSATASGATEVDFGVNKGAEAAKPHSNSMDHLKSVRSAREQLDLEPSRQNSHACRVELVVKLMETDVTTGLTAAEAAARLEKYGLNKLADPVAETLLQRLWRQINQILIWILIVACIVSGAVQSWPEFGLIIAVVVINVILGVVQEGKASKATAALKNMLSSKATVIRDGNRMEIEATQVVPGDVIFMESGNKVPADVRLFQVSNLQVQEAMLTGESLPVSKVVKPVALQVGLGDRKNMCYSATLVVKGQGTGVCVATGDTTEIGRIAELVSEVKETKTNLLKQIDAFGRWIGMVVLPIALATFLIALLTPVDLSNGGDTPVNGTATNSTNNKAQQSFIIAVAIAVSMIPAGLPAIITICLAIATTYMAKQNAIVKTLPSVETLGSVMVICSDKTGTLTKNEMTVVAARTQARKYNVAGVGYDPAEGTVQGEDGADPLGDQAFKALIRGGTLNNESRIERTEEAGRKFVAPIGDPSECALCCVAEKSKIDIASIKNDYPRVGVIPFESEHKFMVTFHKDPQDDRNYLAIVKGAPDRLAAKSSKALQEDGSEAEIDHTFWNEQVTSLSSNGYRCLAVCQTKVSAVALPEVLAQGAAWVSKAETPFLTYVGLVAILDPPREECITAIREAHRAGIIVKMITGDHPATAKSIGKQLGIVDEEHTQVLTGPELDRMSIEDLEKVVVQCNVFARASPDNKISIVRALQNQKKVCSMTGDGVNDAPALRAADIGVAMGITGSDVSKDAAKIILTDDNFATILIAVREGRRVWDNLRKILLFNMPANFAQGGVIFIAVCLQWPVVPLTAIQVLYVNMITACTLGLIFCIEPAESTVMDRPPRRLNKGLIGSFFYWRNIYVTSIFITFVLGSVSWIKAMDPVKYGATAQRAIAFNCLIFCEIGYAMSCRFLKLSSIHPRVFRGNRLAWVCAIFMGSLNVMVTYVPGLNTFFSMSAMDGPQWGIVFLFAICAFLLVELEKFLSDPLRPYTRPIVLAMQGCFAKIPSCPSFSRLWNCTTCCDVDQQEKPRDPVNPANKQGGSMRAVPEDVLREMDKNASSAPLLGSAATLSAEAQAPQQNDR